MTIQELIDILSDYDPDAQVFIEDGYLGENFAIDQVIEIDSGTKVVIISL